MLDLLLTNDHDLDISAFDLQIVADAGQVRQQLKMKLKLWKGEWFLDTEFGTPYLQEILGKQLTLSGALASIRASILEVEGVRQITSFNYNFNNSTRLLALNFEVDTPFGLIGVNV